MEYLFYDAETRLAKYTIVNPVEALIERQGLPYIVVPALPEDISLLCVVDDMLLVRSYPPMCPSDLKAGESWDMSTLPEGSFVEVFNSTGEGFSITDFSEPLTFLDPGSYVINVLPPEPWLEHVYPVEISNA